MDKSDQVTNLGPRLLSLVTKIKLWWPKYFWLLIFITNLVTSYKFSNQFEKVTKFSNLFVKVTKFRKKVTLFGHPFSDLFVILGTKF